MIQLQERSTDLISPGISNISTALMTLLMRVGKGEMYASAV